jgi:hypothetical protein
MASVSASCDRETFARLQDAVMESRVDARGLPLLVEEELKTCPFGAPTSSDFWSADTWDVDVEVVVKHTFIELVDPTINSRTRAKTDSCLFSDCATTKPRLGSDASTEDPDVCTRDTSFRDDNALSDDDGSIDVTMFTSCRTMGFDDEDQLGHASFQANDRWWMSGSFETSKTTFACNFQLDASAEPFVPAWMQAGMGAQSNKGKSLCWADQTDELDKSIQQESCCDLAMQDWRTTVMLRNMPKNYTRDMLIELVYEMGFDGAYDFIYMPIDFSSQVGLGYAFINFTCAEKAQLSFHTFEGFSDWKVPSDNMCTVNWSDPCQGLEAHIERYRNSPVMHQSIVDEWKPALFSNGKRVTFPPPTKTIKMPKIRQLKKQ